MYFCPRRNLKVHQQCSLYKGLKIFLEKWLISGLEQETCKMSLGNLVIPQSKEAMTEY